MAQIRTVSLVASVGLIATLVACGSKKDPDKSGPGSSGTTAAPAKKTNVDWNDLAGICKDGKGIDVAAAYEKKAGAPSPFAFMYQDTAGGKTAFERDYASTSKPWIAEDAKDAQLVACMEVVKADKSHDCKFEKGGVQEMYNTSLKVTVYETKTGKKLSEQTVEHKMGKGCPSIAFMKDSVEREYGELEPVALRAVAEFQGADAPQPTQPAESFDNACDGKPAIGAGKRATSGGVYNPYVTFVRAKDGPWTHGAANEYDFDESAWFDANLKAQSGREAQKVSVAVCMTSTRGEKAEDCEFSGGSKVTMYKAKWKVDVVEASTGKVLQTKEFQGKVDCPSIWSADKGTEFDALPGDDARDWLKPIVAPK